MHKGKSVIYVDSLGKAHDALVRAVNVMHPGFVTVAYVDEKADERDNVVVVYDVPHKDDESRADVRMVIADGPTSLRGTAIAEGNPDLPHFDINVWMERDEEHTPLPADHPAFDHPWKQPELDQQGNRIPVVRTEYERLIEEHKHPKPTPPAPPAPPAKVDAFSIENGKLKSFLMENFKNETGDETPVDCAIRLLGKQVKKDKKDK